MAAELALSAAAGVEPTICYNDEDNFMENGTNYEWFICPNVSQTYNYNYCCGEADRQHCCRFWDESVVIDIYSSIVIVSRMRCIVNKVVGVLEFSLLLIDIVIVSRMLN